VDNKKIKINCSLTPSGTPAVDESVANDMSVSDPETSVGMRIIDDAMSGDVDKND